MGASEKRSELNAEGEDLTRGTSGGALGDELCQQQRVSGVIATQRVERVSGAKNLRLLCCEPSI